MTPIFAVPLLVEDIDAATREAIHAKVTAYLKSERAKRDKQFPHACWQTAIGHEVALIFLSSSLVFSRPPHSPAGSR